MNTQTQAAPEPLFGNIPLDNVFESATNPRKRFDPVALQELADSIKAHGVGQPILVRPMADRADDFEIVSGARRYRASKIAEAPTIPAIVRNMSDKEAQVFQSIENLQREDVHPIEEAEGYEKLMREHGYSADQLAAEVGKSRSYVYARLKYSALCPEAREAFFDGKLNASTALLIARIPGAALQVKACMEVLAGHFGAGSEPMSYRAAVSHLRSRYMLDLARAPFALDDTKLLSVAGACTTCPKRTGNQPELFSDVDSADVCTDPDCFASKRDALNQRTAAQAKKKGLPIHEAANNIWATLRDLGKDEEWTTLRDRPSDFARHEYCKTPYQSLRDILPEACRPNPVAYLQLKNAEMEPVFEITAMQAALEKAGICLTPEAFAAREQADAEASGDSPDATRSQAAKQPTAEQLKQAEEVRKSELETQFHEALYRKILEFVESGFTTAIYRALMQFLVRDCVELSIGQLSSPMAEKFPSLQISDEDALLDRIEAASIEECECLLLDATIGYSLEVGRHDLDELEESPIRITLLSMAASAKVDVDQLRAAIFSPPAEAIAEPAPAGKKKSGKKSQSEPAAAWPFPTGARPTEYKKQPKKSEPAAAQASDADATTVQTEVQS